MFTTATLVGRGVAELGARLAPRLSSTSTMGHQEGRGEGDSTYNQEEVDKFRAMAGDWWNPSGSCRPLHSMNVLRVPLVREALTQEGAVGEEHRDTARPLQGLRLLDVGCGGGLLSEPLARIGATVVGLDAAQENITAARAHAAMAEGLEGRLTYLCTTVEQHAEGLEHLYDAVVASEVIEHVDNQEMFLRKCVEVVKPGGSIFITTLNRTTRSWLLAIVGAEYVVGLLPRGTHQWEKFVPPSTLVELAEGAGCTSRSLQGMAYMPWSDSWAWQDDCSVNYALHAVKLPS